MTTGAALNQKLAGRTGRDDPDCIRLIRTRLASTPSAAWIDREYQRNAASAIHM